MKTLGFISLAILVPAMIIVAALLAGCGMTAPAVPPTPAPRRLRPRPPTRRFLPTRRLQPARRPRRQPLRRSLPRLSQPPKRRSWQLHWRRACPHVHSRQLRFLHGGYSEVETFPSHPRPAATRCGLLLVLGSAALSRSSTISSPSTLTTPPAGSR